jgi:hypothetical protein
VECECASHTRRVFAETRPVVGDEHLENIASARLPDWTYWKWIVSAYSALMLTYPSDALPALSGIAKEFGRASDDQYQAGLWRKTLVSDLLWRREGEAKDCRKAMPWRAPSWSWLLTLYDESIVFSSIHETLAHVVSVDCSTAGLDPTGALSSASLVLRAQAFQTAFVVRRKNNTDRENYGRPYKWSISIPHFDIGGWCDTIGSPLGDLGLLAATGTHPYTCLLECMEGQPNVYIVLIGKNTLPSDRRNNENGALYMILTEQSDGLGTWERLGLVKIPDPPIRWEESDEQQQDRAQREAAISALDAAPVMEFYIV